MRITNVTIDCADPRALAEFYSALLGRDIVLEAAPYVVVAGDGGQPNLVFQHVDYPTPGKAKVHVDLQVADLDAEVERAVGLGATRGEEVTELGMTWRVMADPEGNPFCVAGGV